MEICNDHNYIRRGPDPKGKFGIKISLPPGDSFAKIVGENWETFHWFCDSDSRNNAMAEMAKRHRYSRIGDNPRLVLQAIER